MFGINLELPTKIHTQQSTTGNAEGLIAQQKGGDLDEGKGIVRGHDGDEDRNQNNLVAVAQEPGGDPFE